MMSMFSCLSFSCVFFGEISFYDLYPFLIRLFIFVIELYVFLIYFGYQTLIRYVVCKYILPETNKQAKSETASNKTDSAQ